MNFIQWFTFYDLQNLGYSAVIMVHNDDHARFIVAVLKDADLHKS